MHFEDRQSTKLAAISQNLNQISAAQKQEYMQEFLKTLDQLIENPAEAPSFTELSQEIYKRVSQIQHKNEEIE